VCWTDGKVPQSEDGDQNTGQSRSFSTGIEVGTTKSIDELCMDNFICDAVFYFCGLDQELLLGPK
jgi:hypothetical protein